MHYAKVTDAGRNAESWHPENLAPYGHISLGYTRSRQLPRSTARHYPLNPDRWASCPRGQLVKGMRAPQRHSQSVTRCSGTMANRRDAGPAPPPTCSPLAPHPTARGVSILDPHHSLEWGSGWTGEPQFPSPGTALARCPVMQGREGGMRGPEGSPQGAGHQPSVPGQGPLRNTGE